MATVTAVPAAGASPLTAKRRMMRGATPRPAFFTWPTIAFGERFAFFASKPSSARPSATEMTGHGPASITVTGTCVPSALKIRVIPNFRPIKPFIMTLSPCVFGRGAACCAPTSRFLLDLNLHVHTGRQIELRQRIHRLRPRVEDVDQALVRLELELLAALLVDVRAAQHRPQLPLCGQWDRTRDLRSRLLSSPYNVCGRLVDESVVERL